MSRGRSDKHACVGCERSTSPEGMFGRPRARTWTCLSSRGARARSHMHYLFAHSILHSPRFLFSALAAEERRMVRAGDRRESDTQRADMRSRRPARDLFQCRGNSHPRISITPSIPNQPSIQLSLHPNNQQVHTHYICECSSRTWKTVSVKLHASER